MEFRTPFKFYENEAQPSGEKIEYVHREFIDSKGKKELIRDVAVNTYEKIQAEAESCNINNIIKRATEGDISILNQIQGSYQDITDAPHTLAEAQNTVIRLKREFNSLDKEVRYSFGNNIDEYIASYGSEEWMNKTGLSKKIATEKEAKANKEKYEKEYKEAIKKLAEGVNTND